MGRDENSLKLSMPLKLTHIQFYTFVKCSIFKVTRFFRYRYPLIVTRSVLVPVSIPIKSSGLIVPPGWAP